jgi:hypothetical protein
MKNKRSFRNLLKISFINILLVTWFIQPSGVQALTSSADIHYAWHTFYGTRYDRDRASAVAVDSAGNSYIVGDGSVISWNGPAGQPPLRAHNVGNNPDLFLLKLNSNGEYQWHTFFGGAGGCNGSNNATNTVNNIALDSSGNIIVEGTSCVSWGTPFHAHSGADDFRTNLFVVKFDQSGNYLWNTFYEQKNMNASMGKREMALDGNGNIYVATTAYYGWDGPSGQVALHLHTPQVANIYDNSNMLILKLDSDGAYQWHTFYGTNGEDDGPDWAQDITVDAAGNVFVTGTGASWGFPLHASQGSNDIIVMSLNTNGLYQWHTYYGSPNSDEAQGIDRKSVV